MLKVIVRLLKSTFCLLFVLGMMAMFAASPSYADKCSSKDREPLPSCVSYQINKAEAWYNSKSENASVRNNCTHPVTIKFVKEGEGDSRKTVQPNVSMGEGSKKGIELYCCPRYNSCANN